MPAASRRTFYAIQAAGISKFFGDGTSKEREFFRVAGLQSVGINTNFNVEALYQLGKLDLYSNVEGIPEIEVSMEKPLDGSPLIYEMATMSRQTSAPTGAIPILTTDVLVNDPERSLIARSNARCNILLSIHSDTQSEVPALSGAGTDASNHLVQCIVSGAYISQVSYKMGQDGNFSESASFVANDKKWFGTGDNGFRLTASTGLPTFKPGTGTLDNARQILRKQYVNWSGCYLPTNIPGVNSSGQFAALTATGTVASGFAAHIQSINTSVNLGRESLNELGRRSPYFRYVKFPVEVTTEIEVLVGGATPCDFVSATTDGALDAAGGVNVSSESILLTLGQAGSSTAHREMTINLGNKNVLTSVNYQGGGTDGGNSTATYSFRNFNNFTIHHALSESKLFSTYSHTLPFGV